MCCKKRKGQASFEYILVAAVIGMTILPAAYLFYSYSSSTADELDKAQLDQLGRDITATAEKIYFQGAPSRTELESRLPKGIQNISIIGDWGSQNQELIFQSWSTQTPDMEFPYPAKVNINGTFNGSLYGISVGAGIKKISIEAYETPPSTNGEVTSFVYINFGGRCPRSTVYDFNTNGVFDIADWLFIEQCKTDQPGRPNNRPSKTWRSGWFDNTGFAMGNPYAVCMNTDYDGDCDVDDTDRANFCAKSGLC